MDVYREYAESPPHPKAVSALRWWHRRLASGYELLAGRSLSGLNVLEVGVGHGYFAVEAQSLGARYKAVDMSESIAHAARASGIDVQVARIPPLPDSLRQSADVVWMSHVLEHAKDWPEAHAMAEAAFDALRPGGHFVVIGPDANDWGHRFWDVDHTHGYPTTIKRCVRLLRDCGFQSVKGVWHRGGFFGPLGTFLAAAVAKTFPYELFDALVSRRGSPSEGFGYSYMTIFGWRQIFVIGQKPHTK